MTTVQQEHLQLESRPDSRILFQESAAVDI